MKNLKKLVALILVLVSISCSKSNTQKTAFSKEAMKETLLTTTDDQLEFQEILFQNEGKNIVIEVWASWCGDCIKSMPKFKELQAAHPEVVYVFISMDKTADKWKAGIEKYNLSEAGAHFMANDQMGGVFAKAIDLDWIPRYIIIDKTGKIVLYRAIEKDFDQMNTILNELEK